MAPRPTPEETAARHRAKLIDHPFVPVAGSRLCGHTSARIDPLGLLAMSIRPLGRRAEVDPAALAEHVRCNAPAHRHAPTETDQERS